MPTTTCNYLMGSQIGGIVYSFDLSTKNQCPSTVKGVQGSVQNGNTTWNHTETGSTDYCAYKNNKGGMIVISLLNNEEPSSSEPECPHSILVSTACNTSISTVKKTDTS